MYIYLIFDPFSRLTKIGKSKNPKKRFEAIRTSNPNAELFFYSDEYTEKELHEQFKDKRETYEWFSLDKHDLFSITKSMSCIPKRLHYSNTKKDLLRKEINDRKNSLFDYTFVCYLKDYPEYKFTKCKKCFNTKTGRQIKQVTSKGSIGYNIRGKFISLSQLRNQLIKITKDKCPF